MVTGRTGRINAVYNSPEVDTKLESCGSGLKQFERLFESGGKGWPEPH